MTISQAPVRPWMSLDFAVSVMLTTTSPACGQRRRAFSSARADLEHRRLVQRLADDLQAQRQAVGVEPGRHRNARQAGQVRRHREDVVQVHRHRVDLLVAEREGGRRRGRRQDGVDLAPDLVEVLGDAAADLQRLDVVGVVEAGRQHIGADQVRRRWTSSPKPSARRVLVEVGQGLRVLGPEAEAHAVVAGQVRRRLGRGDDVVGRQGVFGVRQADRRRSRSRRPSARRCPGPTAPGSRPACRRRGIPWARRCAGP